MRLELKVRRRQWVFFAVLFLVVGIPFAIAAPLLLVESIVARNGGALVGVVIGALLGGVSVPAGVAAWRIGRSHPAIVVAEDALTLEHPGFFVGPFHLSRTASTRCT